MDQVNASIKALHSAASNKKQRRDVGDALEQISSVAKLLSMSALSIKMFERLSLLLRDHLQPLYHSFLSLSLQYCDAVLLTILHDKIQPTEILSDAKCKYAWEQVQVSLLSGILDYLDVKPSSNARVAVGVNLYPTLCRLSCLCPPNNAGGANQTLLCTVYQLLSETVVSEPENQRKLRSAGLLGGRQLGVTLSQIKDFLAIEALLELFANLLPSAKAPNGGAKRSQFIKEVFNSEVFSCSSTVIQLLESITTTEWNVTAIKLIDAMAHADITCPQPFETKNIAVRGSVTNTIDRVYVDQKGFLANLEEDDQIETFQILYESVKTLKLSAPSAFKTTVTMVLATPPVIGQRSMAEGSEEGRYTVTFDLKNGDVEKFLHSLQSRGLGAVINQSERKLSKAQVHIEFNAGVKDKTQLATTQEKVENIVRLWDSSALPDMAGSVIPTSPLLARELITPLVISPIVRPDFVPNLPAVAESITPPRPLISRRALMVKTNALGPDCCGLSPLTVLNTPLHIGSSDEIDLAAPRKSRGKKRLIVISDNDNDDDDDDIEPLVASERTPIIPPKGTVKSKTDSIALLNSVITNNTSSTSAPQIIGNSEAVSFPGLPGAPGSGLEGASLKNDLPPPAKSPPKSSVNTIPLVRTRRNTKVDAPEKGTKLKRPDTPVQAPTKKPKRKFMEVTQEEENSNLLDKSEEIPAGKRSKKSPVVTEVSPVMHSRRAPPAKRYGKKGRTSSPMCTTDKLDFDELPVAILGRVDNQSSVNEGVPKALDAVKSRLATMKGKDGKAIKAEKAKTKTKPKPKPKPLKSAINSKQDEILQVTVLGDDNVPDPGIHPDIDVTTKENAKTVNPVLRRSERFSGTKNMYAEALSKQETCSKKAKKAPWEEDYFIQRMKEGSDDLTPTGLDFQPDIDGDISMQALTAQEHIADVSTGISDYSDDHSKTLANEALYDDFLVPTKGNFSSFESIRPSNEDVVMIDLTKDEPSPRPPTKLNQDVTKQLFKQVPSRENQISPLPKPLLYVGKTKNRVGDSRQSLSFTPPDTRTLTPAKVEVSRPVFERPRSPQKKQSYTKPSAILDRQEEAQPTYQKHKTASNLENRKSWHKKHQEDLTPKIIDVIGQLTDVIVEKTTQRFEDVRQEVRAGRKNILHETAHDLEEMRTESVGHFNALVDLEDDYAKEGRKILMGVENSRDATRDAVRCIGDILKDSGQRSLAKKFPTVLFSKPLPANIIQPKLKF